MIAPEILLAAYAEGLFPMALEGNEIGWFSPDPRGVIPIDGFHAPARLLRARRRGVFEIRMDTAFEAVMRACAADRDEGTWISEEIIESYVHIHQLGFAHSVEVWRRGVLAGGLYGVHLGAAFFGESMFHHVTDASKVALMALVERLRARGFLLLDTQWLTPHLTQFGGIEIARDAYLTQLDEALAIGCQFV